MQDFCGSEFWNSSVTWNTTDPDFTPCFEKTVLVWIPCAFLWIFAPLETHIIIRNKDRNVPWSWNNVSKLVLSTIMVIDLLVLLFRNVHLNNTDVDKFGADFLAPGLLSLSIILQAVFVYVERKRGSQRSGILFIFWLLMAVCMLPPFRTHIWYIMDDVEDESSVGFITFMILYPCVIMMFLLNCFGDKRPQYLAHHRGEKPCPQEDASFLSLLTFSWIDRLIWRGYREPLQQSHLWDLSYVYRSEKVVRSWEEHWQKNLSDSSNTGESDVKAVFTNGTAEVKVLGTSPTKDHYVSILPTLAKTFGKEFAFGALLKLCSDLLQFVSPQILRLLIDFTGDPDAYEWQGYFYAVMLFAVTQVQSIFIGQYFIKMFMVGMKIRTAVVSAVYKKSLKISNSARKESTVGEIVNLMSVDAQRFMDLTTYLNMMWSAPLQIFLSMFFLWRILGPSALAGLAVMIILIPVNAYVSNLVKKLQSTQMKEKDKRVKQMNEILNGIKVLKLYAWENSFEDQVLEIREREVKVLKKAAYLNAATSFIWTCAPFMVLFATFFAYVFSGDDHILTSDKVFVSISLINILRTPLAMLPIIIVYTIQVSLASFATYSLLNEEPLNAELTFVALALFNILRFPISFLPMLISNMVQASVSLKRMNKFMNSEELDPNAVSSTGLDRSPVVVKNGTFAWDKKDEKPTLQSLNVEVPQGSLVGVVGSVGAGKSSFCSALLGEMERISGKVNIKGNMAYVAQQAWIQNVTLRENILFGLKHDPIRYGEVVEACALKPDIEMLAGGDETEIGEKGINLSGGQKQRVSLGRAVYSDSDIYLLDDPLSAVDSHVGKHIFDNVIGPKGMLKDKTRILVTHGLTYLRHMDHIIVLKKGEISEQGSYQELMAKKGDFQEFLLQYLIENPENEEELEGLEEIKSDLKATIGKTEFVRQISRIRQESECSQEDKSPSRQGSLRRNGSLRTSKQVSQNPPIEEKLPVTEPVGKKLIEVEKSETGRVSSGVYSYYIRAMGVAITVSAVFFYAVSQAFSVGSNVWLAEWSEDDRANETSVRNKYLGVYGALGFAQAVTIFVGALICYYGTFTAGRLLHNDLLEHVMRFPMQFFDTNPLGRILNRFSKDVDTLDNLLPWIIRSGLMCLTQVIATLAIISYTTPSFILVMIPTMGLYYFAQLLYVSTSRQLKRIESISRSPIYSHFGETVQGAVTIRAYNKCEEFIVNSQKKVDFNQTAYFPSTVANRWLAVRLEFLGNILTFAAAIFAVYSKDTVSGGDVGLSISYALQVTAALTWLVRMSSDVESNIVSVERIKEYSETEPEAAWDIPQNKPHKDWPQSGKVEFSNYSTRYRDGLDLVVKDIECVISPTEKIGIVGRTGAGKSSLTLGLFRIIEPASGTIVIDGIDIAKLGLHDLRSKLTVIPQDPVLFSGTLRINLDPFNAYSDQQIWNALQHAHLKAFVSELASGLQYEVSEGGENLSVGQRQLVCLARALLRKTKILILDEATAAVDMETDDLIQQTIRREFKDCTVITIAHRLNTIMDSTRILLLNKGRVVEFDSPNNLLANKQSMFYSMAKDAGLV